MTHKTASTRFRKAWDILEKENEDGSIAVLNVLDEENYYIIDAMAAEFWKMLDGKQSVLQIKKILIDKHHPPIKEFERGLNAVIKKLEAHHLVVKSDDV